jgi:hypothetical protein
LTQHNHNHHQNHVKWWSWDPGALSYIQIFAMVEGKKEKRKGGSDERNV